MPDLSPNNNLLTGAVDSDDEVECDGSVAKDDINIIEHDDSDNSSTTSDDLRATFDLVRTDTGIFDSFNSNHNKSNNQGRQSSSEVDDFLLSFHHHHPTGNFISSSNP